ncbi:MAG: ABC transporter ATP-binding protein [Myxococcota bacterium]
MAEMIEARGLTKTFGKLTVLDRLDLRVGPGERVALVGQNGSGKTTLIRCLLGLYRCSGDILIGGHSPRAEREQSLAEVGFVPQLPPGLRATVQDYVRTFSAVCGMEEGRVAGMCSRLGLELSQVRHRRFSELSGGMKQKLMIAIAIARAPKLLIMDEPGANLDPASRATFLELMAQMSPGTTMLLSSHRLDEIASLVTRVVEVDVGRVVMDEKVAASTHTMDGLGSSVRRIRVRLDLIESSESLTRVLQRWAFRADLDPRRWTGEIAAAERFRFLALATRHAANIRLFEMNGESALDAASLSELHDRAKIP